MFWDPAAQYISEYLQTPVWRWYGGEIAAVGRLSGGEERETTAAASVSGPAAREHTAAHAPAEAVPPAGAAAVPEVFRFDRGLLQYLIDEAGDGYPKFTFIRDRVCLVHFRSPHGVFLTGPLSLLFAGSASAALHTVAVKNMPAAYLGGDGSIMPQDAVRCALLLFNTVCGTALRPSDVYRLNFEAAGLTDTILHRSASDLFSNRENQKRHTPYDQELRLQQCIEHGDAQSLPAIWKEPVAGHLGTTAADPVRNGKNLAIVNVTLMTRAAIRGGLPAEEAYTLADAYIRQIEDLQNMLALQPLIEDMQVSLAQMVHEHSGETSGRSEENRLAAQCREYISGHLHERLTVQDIAAAIGAHPNYLSSLFRKTEGVSLYQYILQQKICLTKNLLKYSNYSFPEIAAYLGFSSQSHLGQLFRKATGQTLKQYRDRNKPQSFEQ